MDTILANSGESPVKRVEQNLWKSALERRANIQPDSGDATRP